MAQEPTQTGVGSFHLITETGGDVSPADPMDERGNFPLIEKLLNNST
jgi:hypothetical protein